MDIVLGLDADTHAWPPTTDGTDAQIGGLVTGPAGLLHIVETALGLGGPSIPMARRLARWRAKLMAADTPQRFWHASFRTDPFATAQLLLGWRDRLVDAGWHSQAIAEAPARLGDLAAAELAEPALPPGPADRLRRAIGALHQDAPPEPVVTHVRLLDPRGALPPGLSALLDALEAAGTRITEEAEPDVAAAGDLGAAQGLMRGLREAEAASDGSFTLLEAETETAAADLVADRLLAEARLDDVVLLATRPTSVLDAALRRRHLPRLGLGLASPLRGLLQALPLGLATQWAPFDAHRMIEFLQLPRCPVPREVRSRLIATLPDTPGRGGESWRAAIAEGIEELKQRLSTEESDEARRAQRLAVAEASIKAWLEGDLACPTNGMPIDRLLALCSAMGGWASAQASVDAPLAAVLAGHATALAEAARDTGLDRLPRIELERLLDAVLADGVRNPDPTEEAAPWGSAAAPGAVWGRPRLLIWWGFDAPALPSREPWRAEERAALIAAGCLPWQPGVALAAASAAWRRPILATRNTVLLVAIRDAKAEAHPLAHELAPLLEPHPTLRPRAEALTLGARPRLAGKVLVRRAAARASLPVARPVRTLGAPVSVRRETDSTTALELLLGCPFSWVMRYRARLREGRFAAIADDAKLIGLLAHRLAKDLLRPGPAPSPNDAEQEAAERLPVLIEQAASPLLLPGAAAEKATVEAALPRAIARIAELLRERGLTVVEAEARRASADLLGPEAGLAGDIDLLLADAQGRPALLDFKWSRAARSYRERLQKGEAVQLAAYAALVGANDRAAYVLLPLGEVLGSRGGLGTPPTNADAPDLASTWANAIASRDARDATLQAGTLRALGIGVEKKPPPDPDGASIAPAPPCRFCVYGRLCGKETAA